MTVRALSWMIRLYRAFSATRPPTCRFWPTCSAYGLDAIETHGALRGTGLALKRVIRCRPWGGHGVDLVPLRVKAAKGSTGTPLGIYTSISPPGRS